MPSRRVNVRVWQRPGSPASDAATPVEPPSNWGVSGFTNNPFAKLTDKKS